LKQKKYRSGFTLVEVIAAAMIGAFVAAVAIGSLRTVAAARVKIDINIAAADELRYASTMIQNDLANVYRDRDTGSTKIVGTVGEDEASPPVSLLMYVISPVKARFAGIEGDLYEVEYFINRNEDESFLMRRLCPTLGNETEEEKPAGILTTIAENIIDFRVMYYDDMEWTDQWPEASTSMPSLVEVTLIGVKNPDSEEPESVMRSFIASFPRIGQPRNTDTESEETDDSGNESSGNNNNESSDNNNNGRN
jgi:prepilin-type N-terminal cleavage/methylation domain-containing protein